jgi:hypothetical protein
VGRDIPINRTSPLQPHSYTQHRAICHVGSPIPRTRIRILYPSTPLSPCTQASNQIRKCLDQIPVTRDVYPRSCRQQARITQYGWPTWAWGRNVLEVGLATRSIGHTSYLLFFPRCSAGLRGRCISSGSALFRLASTISQSPKQWPGVLVPACHSSAQPSLQYPKCS